MKVKFANSIIKRLMIESAVWIIEFLVGIRRGFIMLLNWIDMQNSPFALRPRGTKLCRPL